MDRFFLRIDSYRDPAALPAEGKALSAVQYALWVLVLVRLLVPVSFGQSGFSVMNAVTVEQGDHYVWDTGVQAELDAAEQTAAPSAGTDASGVSPGADAGDVPAHTTGIRLDHILRGIWIAGIAAAVILLLFSNLRFAVRLRRSVSG